MTHAMPIDVANDALRDCYHETCDKNMEGEGVNCIVYVFDHTGGTGFSSNNCDTGDAMVAIKRIAEEFRIDLKRLGDSL